MAGSSPHIGKAVPLSISHRARTVGHPPTAKYRSSCSAVKPPMPSNRKSLTCANGRSQGLSNASKATGGQATLRDKKKPRLYTTNEAEPSRRTRDKILLSLPDLMEILQDVEEEPPIDGDPSGNNMYTTAHDHFLFDDDNKSLAVSAEPSEGSTPPDSVMGDAMTEVSSSRGSSSQCLSPRSFLPRGFRSVGTLLLGGCITGASGKCHSPEAIERASASTLNSSTAGRNTLKF